MAYVIAVNQRYENGTCKTDIFSSLENAVDAYPIIEAYDDRYGEMDLPRGMDIQSGINVKKCFVY